MKIYTLSLIHGLLQGEVTEADRAYKAQLTLRHDIEADGKTLTEQQKMLLEAYRENALAAADALADFEEQEWSTREPRQK